MTDDAQLELLRAILLEVRALPTAIAREIGVAVKRSDRKSVLREQDTKAVAMLLPQLARSIGCGVLFSIQDVVKRSPRDPALQAALEQALGTKTPVGKTCQRFGKLLSRASGFVHEDLMLERSVKAEEGRLWQVIRK